MRSYFIFSYCPTAVCFNWKLAIIWLYLVSHSVSHPGRSIQEITASLTTFVDSNNKVLFTHVLSVMGRKHKPGVTAELWYSTTGSSSVSLCPCVLPVSLCPHCVLPVSLCPPCVPCSKPQPGGPGCTLGELLPSPGSKWTSPMEKLWFTFYLVLPTKSLSIFSPLTNLSWDLLTCHYGMPFPSKFNTS